MKKRLFILFLGTVHFSNAQEPVFKIESEVFNILSSELQTKLLPFLSGTTLTDVETDSSIPFDEQVLIKNWSGQHQEIKLIPRSFYNSLDEIGKTSYNDPFNIIILEGEVLRYTDILKFEAL